jgi:hypothetical protein
VVVQTEDTGIPCRLWGKRNDVGACVEHDTALSRRLGQGLEAAKVASVQSGTGPDFDTNEVSRRVFQNDIHLLARRPCASSRTVARCRSRPIASAIQHKILQSSPNESGI